MPQVPEAWLNRAGVRNHQGISERQLYRFGHFLRRPRPLGNVISPDLAPGTRRRLQRPLPCLLPAFLKCEFQPYLLGRHWYKMTCRGIKIATLANTHSAEPLCILSLLGCKLLKLACEIDDIFAIGISRYIRRLLDRVEIESQAHHLEFDWGRDTTSFHGVILIV